MDKQKLIIIAGPTAVGKSGTAAALAREIGGEVISADSMQVYRRMNIGTAKITKEEMEGVPHHLIDVIEPFEDYNVVRFQQMAREAVGQVAKAGHVPILCGGTGFYIQALLYDIDFTENEAQTSVRAELEELAKREGPEKLHELLSRIDPKAAEEIHAHNVKRVIRALEFHRLTGRRISEHNEEQKGKESPYNFAYFVLNDERQRLYERIDARVDEMLEEGLLQEVEGLKAEGLCRGMVSMQGLGYKELLSYLDGECSLEEAVRILKRDTRHFAKRQLTWFRRERDVIWLDRQRFGDDGAILEEMLKILREKGMIEDGA